MGKKNTVYKAAVYMRVSKDDKTKCESESIDTQRKILKSFCDTNGFLICGEYADDGYSGTDFKNRPAFSKLLHDIDNGKINLVITKDLSRLGRNTADTSALLDTLFPQKKVRFISVTENLDTDRRDRNYNLITPVYNFTNELYCADISNKIRSALEIKMKNGEFIGSFAPYGYKKDEKNKNRLVCDEPAAFVVKEIFTLAKNGFSSHEIAEKLNNKNIPTPSAYRKNTNYISAKWSPSSVIKILNNMVYLGHTVQGKTKKPSFKSKQSYSVPKKDWIVKPNTHTAIVDIDTWNTVRNMMHSRKRPHKSGFINIFSGIAKCADCGKNMSSAVSGKNIYLVCGKYKLSGKNACQSHRISYDQLYRAVMQILKVQINLSEDKKLEICNEIISDKSTLLAKNILDTKKQFEFLNQKLFSLLDDKYSGLVDEAEFLPLFKNYKSEKQRIETELASLEKAEDELRKNLLPMLLSVFNEITNLEKLSPEILNFFIDRIDVYQPQDISNSHQVSLDIYFKFKCEKKHTEIYV